MSTINESSIFPNTTLNEPFQYNELTLTRDQQYDLSRIRATGGILTIFGSLFLVMSLIKFKLYKKFYFRLILAMGFMGFLEGIGDSLCLAVFGREDVAYVGCYVQGVLLQLSQNAIFAWTTVIAIQLYIVICLNNQTNQFEPFFHGFVWTWVLFATLLPIAGHAYGPAGAWCWITKSGQPYRWGVFYGPLVIQWILVSVLYIIVIKTIRGRSPGNRSASETKLEEDTLNRLRAYPIIFVVFYFFSLINRIYDSVSTTDSFFLYVMQCLTTPFLGLAVSIAYGLDQKITNNWRDLVSSSVPPIINLPPTEPSTTEVSMNSESRVDFSNTQPEV